MILKRLSLIALLILCAAAAWGADSDPYIGYVYPAGGQQGTTFKAILGGQHLGSMETTIVSGGGVSAKVTGVVGAGGPLNKLQEEELRRRLQEIRTQRMGGQYGGAKDLKFGKNKKNDKSSADQSATQPVTLPDLPELRNLEQQSNKQLLALADKYLNFQKKTKPPIAEVVTLEVTIDANAAPGDREIRLQGSQGLSNPLVFQVGRIPEALGGGKDEDISSVTPVQAPVVLNGQIMPGEIDKFPLQLHGGQKLIVAVQARKLIPYLADAVPGWFQAAVSVYDSSGKELAYDDDCGFVPDPTLTFQVPQDGQYTLAIKDALYRGREDFVYRVDVGDAAAIGSLFPTGSRGGVTIGSLRADPSLALTMARDHFGPTFPTPWLKETEPNDTGQTSNAITLPCVVEGHIAKPGDRDVYHIEGKAGETVVAEVFARRMGSGLDSLLRLIDIQGNVVAMNDDKDDPEAGLFTHHADSYLSAKLPKSGRYFIQISDTEGHGADFDYYLRISHPQPDFALRATPSALNIAAGRAVPVTVYAVRKDGWDGDIEISLKNAPAGFSLESGIIPKGVDHVRMTISAKQRTEQPVVLTLEGRATIDGQTVAHPVVAADDRMQAFAYHHLVTSQQMLASVKRGLGVSPVVDIGKGDRLTIPAGGTAQASILFRSMPGTSIKLELSEPPAGVTLQDVAEGRRGYTLTFKADDKHTGYKNNLLIEAFTEAAPKGKSASNATKQRYSLGFLPAIPFEIAKQ